MGQIAGKCPMFARLLLDCQRGVMVAITPDCVHCASCSISHQRVALLIARCLASSSQLPGRPRDDREPEFGGSCQAQQLAQSGHTPFGTHRPLRDRLLRFAAH
jgi:hypothetical protein